MGDVLPIIKKVLIFTPTANSEERRMANMEPRLHL